jgi:hypothetical protein
MTTHNRLTTDRDQAASHLAAIDTADTRFIFFVIREAEWSPLSADYARHLYGTLSEVADQLDKAQQHGCAVHVGVQEMRGRRRLKNEVARIRAVWCERDQPGKSLPLPPSLRVRTSPGRGHDYLLCDPRDPLTPQEAERVNSQIVADYGGDPNARDLARTLRLTGSWHLKSEPHRVEIIGGTGERYSRAQILEAFPPPPPRPRPQRTAPIEVADRYLAGAAARLADELAQAPVGTRNATLNFAAFRLAQLGLELEPATAMLEPIALQIGLGHAEIRATLQSGWTAGAAKISGRAAA